MNKINMGILVLLTIVLSSIFVTADTTNVNNSVKILEKGKNYIIKNISQDTIRVYRERGYIKNTISSVQYSTDNEIKSVMENHYKEFSLLGGESVRVTISNQEDIDIWVTDEFRDKIEVTPTERPALFYFNMKAATSAIIRNTMDTKLTIYREYASHNNTYSYVKYDMNNQISSYDDKSWYAFSLQSNEKIRLSISEQEDIDFWVPYEQRNVIEIKDATYPALYYFNLKSNDHFKIENISNTIVSVARETAAYSNTVDYSFLDANGDLLSHDYGSYSGFLLKSKCSLTIFVSEQEDIDFWLPYENYGNKLIVTDLKTGKKVIPVGYLYENGAILEDSMTSEPYDYIPFLAKGELDKVLDKASAISTLNYQMMQTMEEFKHYPSTIDYMALFAEEVVALSGNQFIEGSQAILSQNNLSASAETSISTKIEAERILTTNGILVARILDTAVTVHTTDTKKTEINVNADSSNLGIDELRVKNPACSVVIPSSLVQSMGQGGFNILVEILKPGDIAYNKATQVALNDSGVKNHRNASPADLGTKYVVNIDKPLTDNIKISIPPLEGDPTFQSVFNSSGTAVGGKYNPATGMIDVKIKSSDTYTLKTNLKDFSDIQSKSVEMQNAIKVLASKGIIGGTSPTTFSPDSSITRVEIAALILRTLSKLDPKTNGSFNDVKTSDWYFGVAGSAKQFGIMNGLSVGIFAPKNTILKEQIIAVAARTLKNEMKYKDPVNVDSILNVYKDKSSIPSWGTKEIALATKENMVVKRTDSNFVPKGSMSRGDAVVILYRLFSKIW